MTECKVGETNNKFPWYVYTGGIGYGAAAVTSLI